MRKLRQKQLIINVKAYFSHVKNCIYSAGCVHCIVCRPFLCPGVNGAMRSSS